ncbi:hypothetical protein [Actinocatenispora rupis]|uniref:Uncharacterized protein n=1 Tax=Actinocatenispora rupis TaxID=519421 RepID=A0A8J3J6D8_9ACTN|nr:hypothetical protein [Actinocatenispora rupis]GID10914.1 hypothetical protein Aru02nite_18030 [Actinocatenispora rupis]
MTTSDAVAAVGRRWSLARRLAGYVAAASMGLYLLVKVVWIAAALIGTHPAGFGTGGWVALNAVTVLMAAAGVALGLALAQRWGRRLPAVPVVLVSWVGAGFLVPTLPYLVARAVLDAGSGGGGDAAPGWEAVFLSLGFGGMAVGLAVAVPVYLRDRWPRAFLGRLADRPSTPTAWTVATVAAATLLGLLWCYWALGGTLGIDPARLAARDLDGRLLSASSGLWALLGAASLLALRSGRPGRLRRWVPMALAYGASGSLFAWSAWKLPMVLLAPGGFVPVEYVPVAVGEHVLSIATGLALLAGALRNAPARGGHESVVHQRNPS